MRWVVLLLAVAVILPTVCLLWFMMQAVKNERIAVRLKLVDAYELELIRIAQECDSQYKSLIERFVREINLNEKETGKPPLRLPTDFLPAFSGESDQVNQSLIVYDANGQVEFPQFEKPAAELEAYSNELSDIWSVEFVAKDYKKAAALYGELGEKTENNIIKCKALVAKARCLTKEEQYYQAIETCKYLFDAFPAGHADNAFFPPSDVIINNYLMLIELYIKTAQNYDDLTAKLLLALQNTDYLLSVREFGLGKLAALTENGKTITNRSNLAQYNRAILEIKAQRQSLRIAEKYPNISLFGKWKPDTIQKVKNPEPVYTLFFEDNFRKYVLINPPSNLFSYSNNFNKDSFICEFKTNSGDYFGEPPRQTPAVNPILSVPMGNTFPECTVELYMTDANIFDNTADRQVAIYIWAGILVIGLILGTGGLAGSAIRKQMKMNRLKNDFIATVSHELKTPLASMRVLADTLLEGNYKDQQQVTEYLQLICKENKRLTGLIDNFLTFSRMERNKQKFDIIQTSPGTIAQAAAEAVKTKFDKRQCDGKVVISDNLPDIMADHDAMVTVLVNLLDNACKYSYDDKQIELKVFSKDDNVCFVVKDNGIGMTRRQMRKIFDRFYQVDSTLSRRAEGTGLGLSIVKFIVDAHKGEISVDSKPGEGSAFTVTLPGVH